MFCFCWLGCFGTFWLGCFALLVFLAGFLLFFSLVFGDLVTNVNCVLKMTEKKGRRGDILCMRISL